MLKILDEIVYALSIAGLVALVSVSVFAPRDVVAADDESFYAFMVEECKAKNPAKDQWVCPCMAESTTKIIKVDERVMYMQASDEKRQQMRLSFKSEDVRPSEQIKLGMFFLACLQTTDEGRKMTDGLLMRR